MKKIYKPRIKINPFTIFDDNLNLISNIISIKDEEIKLFANPTKNSKNILYLNMHIEDNYITIHVDINNMSVTQYVSSSINIIFWDGGIDSDIYRVISKDIQPAFRFSDLIFDYYNPRQCERELKETIDMWMLKIKL